MLGTPNSFEFERHNGKILPRSLEIHLRESARLAQDVPSHVLGTISGLSELTIVFGNISGIENGASLPINSDLLQRRAPKGLIPVPESHFLNVEYFSSAILGGVYS